MQGQIGGVNGFVVNIFSHYILSDKALLELKEPAKAALGGCGAAEIVKIAAFGSSFYVDRRM